MNVVFNPIKQINHKDKETQRVLDSLLSEINRRMELLNRLARELESKQKTGDTTVTNNITIRGASGTSVVNNTQVAIQRVTTAGYVAVTFPEVFPDSNYAPIPILVRDDNGVGFGSPLINSSDGTYGDTRTPSGLGVYCDSTGLLVTIAGRNE